MESFLQKTAADIIGRYGTDMHRFAFVFINKKASYHLQQELARQIGKPFMAGSFYSIDEFTAGAVPYVTAYTFEQNIILYEVYNALLKEEGAAEISLQAFYRFANVLTADLELIEKELQDADKVFADLRNEAEIELAFSGLEEEEIEILKEFWKHYSDDEQEQQQMFIRMWMRMPKLYKRFYAALEARGYTTGGRAARAAAADTSFCNKYKQVFFIGFNKLNRAEEVMFSRLQQEGKALFYFDVDYYYYADKLQEAGKFLRRNLNVLELQNALPGGDNYINVAPKEMQVVQCQGNTAQVKMLAHYINNYTPVNERVAVILNDEQDLLNMLQSITPQQGLEVNVTMALPINATMLYGLVELWIDVQEAYLADNTAMVNVRSLQTYVTHPLTGFSMEAREKLLADVIKVQRLELPPDYDGFTAEVKSFFTRAATGRQVVSGAAEYYTALYKRAAVSKEISRLDAEMLQRLLQAITQVSNALHRYIHELDAGFILVLLRNTVKHLKHLMLNGETGGLQVLGLNDSMVLDFDKVFISGTAEGLLPKKNFGQTFIPYSIRKVRGMPTQEDEEAQQAYLFYRLIKRARNITMLYDATGNAMGKGEVSRYVKQLEYESIYAPAVTVQKLQPGLPHREPITVDKNDRMMHELAKYYDNGDGRNKALSASALNTYLACPLKFYYMYVANMREPDKLPDEVEANSIGSIVHDALYEFYKPLENNNVITADIIAQGQEGVPALVKKSMAKELFKGENNMPDKLSGMQQIVLRVVATIVNKVLDYDKTLGPFTILQLEQRLVQPYDVQLEDQTQRINLLGIIDRVDEVAGLRRIVDYKTGGDELQSTALSALMEGNRKGINKAYIQTLLYTMIYKRKNNIQGYVQANLYLTKNLSKTQFSKVKDYGGLTDAEYHVREQEDFELVLQKTLRELFSSKMPFIQTPYEQNCTYCPYLQVCGK